MSIESEENIFLGKKRECPDGSIEKEDYLENKDQILEKSNQQRLSEIIENCNTTSETKKEKEKDKDNKKKQKVKKNNEMSRDEKIIKEIKKAISPNKIKELIKKGFNNFIKKKEYDFFLLYLIKHISNLLQNFKEFKEDYTYYIYNNLRALILSKELNKVLIKISYNTENETFYKEFLNLSNERWKKFINTGKKYKIKLLDDYLKSIKPEEKKLKSNNNSNNSSSTNSLEENEQDKFDMNKTIEIYNNFPEDNQLEIIIAGIVFNSLLKNEKEQIKEVQINNNNNNSISPITPVKIEIQNFNLPEMAMISVLSGIKFNTNITEINLSGNSLSPKSCFWLGSINKTNPNLLSLDISKCNINNDCLYMFAEGASFSDEKLNKEQFNLERLNLKDNNQINSQTVEGFEHPLALIFQKFKLKWINLTNAKLGGEGALKLIKKMEELLGENKLFLQNLILICNDIKNEECLSKLGNILLKDNCPLQNLILSKNLISSPITSKLQDEQILIPPLPPINYFKNLMECVAKSKLKELFLISCEIGSNENDIDILYQMLKENKSLTSLRLFGNKISSMDSFKKILGIFSDYNKPLENSILKCLDLSKNSCNIKIDEDFMQLIEHLKLEYLDVNQNMMESNEKEIFKKRTNDLNNIKIIY